ncbi:MAG: chloride channel protein [Actinobacteria bacterium]|nr:chloride channel protein [Actinomycetota bacterium]
MSRFVRVSMVLATGLLAGLGVVMFHYALQVLRYVLMHLIGISRLVSIAQTVSLGGSRLFLLPVVIFLGFAISKFVATKSGISHRRERGADRIIEVVNGEEVALPMAEAMGTAVAGVVALGLGVSGGPEGPIAMLVGGPIVNLLSRFGIEERQLRILVAAGVGSALATLFRAPLAGVFLAGELFVLEGFLGAVVLPGLLVAAITWFVGSTLIGNSPLIGHLSLGRLQPEAYLSAIVLGLGAGLVGLGYRWWVVVVGTRLTHLSRSRVLWWLAVAVVVSAITSALALVVPEVLSTGSGWIRLVAAFGSDMTAFPLWLLLATPLARLVLTGLSLSAEAPVGVLGPALIIGAFSGAALWRLSTLVHLSATFGGASLFALLMFAAVFGSIGRVPLSMVVIAIEATGALAAAPLVMVSVGIAVFMVRQRGMTIFGSQALPGQSPIMPT